MLNKDQIMLGILQGDTDAVIQALGDDVNTKLSDNETALHLAIKSQNVAMVNALIAAGADVNVKDTDGNTPLYIAVEKGNAEIVNALMAAGASISVNSIFADTPLHLAAGKINVPVYKEIFRTLEPHYSTSAKINLARDLFAVLSIYALNHYAGKVSLGGVAATFGMAVFADWASSRLDGHKQISPVKTCMYAAYATTSVLNVWGSMRENNVYISLGVAALMISPVAIKNICDILSISSLKDNVANGRITL